MTGYHAQHQRNIDNQSPDESAGKRAEKADDLRHALKADADFIAEAIGNGDMAALVAGYAARDTQQCWDAISDLVDAYLADGEDSHTGRHDDALDGMTKLAAAFGVFA